MSEIGASYSKATGRPLLGEEMPLEESGNIINLDYAYSATASSAQLLAKKRACCSMVTLDGPDELAVFCEGLLWRLRLMVLRLNL